MKKPVIIRLIGWVGVLFFLLLAFTLWHLKEFPQTPGLLMLLVALVGCTIASWSVWGIASGVVWVLRKQGQPVAASVPDGSRAAVTQWAAGSGWPFTGLYCVTHKAWLHAQDVIAHDSKPCLYVPNLPTRFSAHSVPVHEGPVMTSPLGLNQKR